MSDRQPAPPYLKCPSCGAMNKPGAKPTLEMENGTVTCVSCGTNFKPPKDAA